VSESPESLAPVLLGRISGVFGVKGWLKIFSHTEPREAVVGYSNCLVKRDGSWSPVTWAEGKRHGKMVIARPEGVDNREIAEKWIGAELGVRREDLPPVESGSFYWSDLEGLTVVRRNGDELGHVSHLMATGAHDVLVVQGTVKGEQEVLIPFVLDEYVIDVDLDVGVIKVDWDWD
jgi:16S rRNA processing protein RimM